MWILDWLAPIAVIIAIGTFLYAVRGIFLQQVDQFKSKAYSMAKFLHEHERNPGISKLGAGILYAKHGLNKWSLRRVKWIVTGILFTSKEVSVPAIQFSRKPYMDAAAIETINALYGVGEQKDEIRKMVVAELLDTRGQKPIIIDLSDKISVYLAFYCKRRRYRKKLVQQLNRKK